MYFCSTKLFLFNGMYFCSVKCISVKRKCISFQQHVFIFRKIYFCSTTCISVQQNGFLFSKMYFCSTKVISVQRNVFLFNKRYFCSTECISVHWNVFMFNKSYFCSTTNIFMLLTVNCSSITYTDFTVGFPLQQYLCERATKLRHTYTLHLGPFRRTSEWSVECPTLMGTDDCQIK